MRGTADAKDSLRWLELDAGPAVCRSAQASERAAASRVLAGRWEPGPAIHQSATQALGALDDTVIGRVIGLGQFSDATLAATLSRALSEGFDVLPRFEWYACRGAGFHNDAHYGGVLFGAWCISGPHRDVVFARARQRVSASEGDFVVFDPFEPHAVLDSGHNTYSRDHYAGAAPSMFVGFEIEINDTVRRSFGIGAIASGAVELSSRIAINPETGAW